MKRIIMWYLINGAVLALLFVGKLADITGAWNLVVFMIWMTFFLTPFMFTQDMQKHLKEKGRSVNQYINMSYDWFFVFVLAWFGHWFLAVIYFIHHLMQEAAWAAALDNKENATKEELSDPYEP